MIIDTFIIFGGHKFSTASECATFFDVPINYVEHMLESDDYPGCQQWVTEEYISFVQTLAVMKSSDARGSHVTTLPKDMFNYTHLFKR